MPKGIIILGLNGCGKSTLTRAVAERLGYRAFDIEDYFFEPSEVPYSKPRSREECYAALLTDIKAENRNFVLAHVRGDCGGAVNAMYAFAVLLTAPPEVRAQRVQSRALEKFGDRILPGGDMYQQEEEFFRMAAARSEEELEPFLALFPCPVLRLDSTESVRTLTDKVITAYQKTFPSER